MYVCLRSCRSPEDAFDLSQEVGISLANLSILKNNKGKAIRFSTLDALCRALNCQPGELLEYTEEPIHNSQ